MVLVWERWNNSIVWCFLGCAWNIDIVVMVDICVLLILLIHGLNLFILWMLPEGWCWLCLCYSTVRFVLRHIYCVCAYALNNLICLYMQDFFFKDIIFKLSLINQSQIYFVIISWHALVFCSLSRHWYLRSQSLTSWMIHIPKVKCSKDPDCHRRCGIFTKIIYTC